MRKLDVIVRRLADTTAAEIAEAAMVLPLVFMFLLGIIWFGRVFNIYSTITQAAQQGAITAARSTCATCGDTAPNDTAVYNTVSAVLQASSIDPTQIPANPSPPSPVFCASPPVPPPSGCTTNNQVTVCRQVLLNPPAASGQPAQCGTMVSFQYPFQFYLPFTSLNLQKVTLTAQAQSRMEN
jgi:hypothetical protein